MAVRTTKWAAARTPEVSAKSPSRSALTMSSRQAVPCGRSLTITRPARTCSRSASVSGRCPLAVADLASSGAESGFAPSVELDVEPGDEPSVLRTRSRSRTAEVSCASRVARQSVQAAGPAAAASASVSALSRAKMPASPPTAARAASTVPGSVWSRRVASSISVRCSRTSSSIVATSSASKPSRRAMSRATGAPSALWSCAPLTLPMSCRSAATSRRSGRATSRAKPRACTTVSMRWRSTVCRWTGLRCGRERTRDHSGIQRSMRPT